MNDHPIMRECTSYPGYFACRNGTIFSEKSNKFLKTRKSQKGYYYFFPRCKGKSYTVSVHREIAKAWIENPCNKPEVNHKNGIKSDNRYHNLQWVTKSENEIHCRYVLKKNINENHHQTNLKNKDVREIKKLLTTKMWTQKHIAEAFYINESVVNEINRGLTWRNVWV